MAKTVEQYLEDRELSPPDKKIILEYLRSRLRTGDINAATEKSMATYFCMLQRKTGPLDDLTTDRLLEALYQFRQELSPTSFDRMRAIVITFVKWYVKKGKKGVSLEEIKETKRSKSNKTRLKPSDMLKWDDINKMVESANSVRDKALILLLFESALRPAEVCNLTWRDLHFTNDGVVVTTGRKTGRERRILCVKSEPWLKTYREILKSTEQSDWVFPSRTKGKKGNNPIGIWGLQPIVKNAAAAAGLKGVYPYLMRHSRITSLVEAGLQETALKKVAWGNLGSSMLTRYVHLSDEATDEAMRSTYGDLQEEKTKPTEPAPVCSICGERGEIGKKFCGSCGASYDGSVPSSKLEIMQENEELKKRLEKLEEQSALLDKMVQMALKNPKIMLEMAAGK